MEQGHKHVKAGKVQMIPKDLMDESKKPLALEQDFIFSPVVLAAKQGGVGDGSWLLALVCFVILYQMAEGDFFFLFLKFFPILQWQIISV